MGWVGLDVFNELFRILAKMRPLNNLRILVGISFFFQID